MKRVIYANVKLYLTQGNWYAGYKDGYEIEAKMFEEPSDFGIDGGRISKLWIKGDRVNRS